MAKKRFADFLCVCVCVQMFFFGVFNIACKWLFNRVAGYKVTLEHTNTNTWKWTQIVWVRVRTRVQSPCPCSWRCNFPFMCERERIFFLLWFILFILATIYLHLVVSVKTLPKSCFSALWRFNFAIEICTHTHTYTLWKW